MQAIAKRDYEIRVAQALYQADRISSPNALAATIESKRTVAASTPFTSIRKMDASAAAIAAEAASIVPSSNFIATL
jgi:hypothetical protein